MHSTDVNTVSIGRPSPLRPSARHPVIFSSFGFGFEPFLAAGFGFGLGFPLFFTTGFGFSLDFVLLSWLRLRQTASDL